MKIFWCTYKVWAFQQKHEDSIFQKAHERQFSRHASSFAFVVKMISLCFHGDYILKCQLLYAIQYFFIWRIAIPYRRNMTVWLWSNDQNLRKWTSLDDSKEHRNFLTRTIANKRQSKGLTWRSFSLRYGKKVPSKLFELIFFVLLIQEINTTLLMNLFRCFWWFINFRKLFQKKSY